MVVVALVLEGLVVLGTVLLVELDVADDASGAKV